MLEFDPNFLSNVRSFGVLGNKTILIIEDRICHAPCQSTMFLAARLTFFGLALSTIRSLLFPAHQASQFRFCRQVPRSCDT